MDGAILAALAGIAGLGFGFAADRLAARWPEHVDGAVRPLDWRTPIVALAGGLAFAAAVARFGEAPAHLLIVGLYAAALIVLLATDLDQRLLPDVVTLPLVAFSVAAFALGANPFVRTIDELAWAAAAAVAVPAALFVLAIPFGAGAIGLGDLKLLVSVGLLVGAERMIYGLVVGTLSAGVVIVILLLARRITLRSYVPYGPFLIAGALWALLGIAER